MNTDVYLKQLKQDGILILNDFVSEQWLTDMQQSFNHKLEHINFNSTSGYQRYEMYRDYVENLLMVDPSFMKFAVQPELVKIIKGYISENLILKESRGWRTRIVKKHFHSWHKDGWYDKKIYSKPPKQLKVVIYLTDVTSGSFSYIKGSHRKIKSNPHILHEHFTNEFIEPYKEDIVFALGKAGTVIIFDTSGIHCQNSPNLSPRNAAFYTYNDAEICIDSSELAYGRYGQLFVSNEFINDGFTVEDLRILGFFQKKSGNKAAQNLTRYPILSSLVRAEVEAAVYLHQYVFSNVHRVVNRLIRSKNRISHKLFKRSTKQ